MRVTDHSTMMSAGSAGETAGSRFARSPCGRQGWRGERAYVRGAVALGDGAKRAVGLGTLWADREAADPQTGGSRWGRDTTPP